MLLAIINTSVLPVYRYSLSSINRQFAFSSIKRVISSLDSHGFHYREIGFADGFIGSARESFTRAVGSFWLDSRIVYTPLRSNT